MQLKSDRLAKRIEELERHLADRDERVKAQNAEVRERNAEARELRSVVSKLEKAIAKGVVVKGEPSDNVRCNKVCPARFGFRSTENLPSRSLQSASGMCEN